MKSYAGKPESEEWAHVGQVFVVKDIDTSILDPRYDIVNHSPDGFGWGYYGSGAAQLAFAILMDFTDDQGYALIHYQRFKDDIIAKLPRAPWVILEVDLKNWMNIS